MDASRDNESMPEERLPDSPGTAVFLVSPGGRVTCANRRAVKLLQRFSGLERQIAQIGMTGSPRVGSDGIWIPLADRFFRLGVRPADPDPEAGMLVTVDADDLWDRLGEELAELRSRIVFFECDPRGRIVSGLPALARATGGEETGSVPEMLVDLLDSSSREKFDSCWAAVLRGTPLRGIELETESPPGTRRTFWFSFFPLRGPDGSTVGVRAMARDISRERGLSYALEAADERFNVLFREASDPVLIFGTDGSILAANPAFERLTGVRVDELFTEEKAWEDLIHPEDRPQLKAALRECTTSDSGMAVEYQLKCSDGSYVWVEQVHSVLHDENGKVRGLLAVARDITRWRRREMDLRRTAAETISQHEKARDLIVRMTRLFRDIGQLPPEYEQYVEGMCRILHRMFNPLVVWMAGADGSCHTIVWREDIPPPMPEDACRQGLESLARKVLQRGLPYFRARLPAVETMAAEPAVKDLHLAVLLAAPVRDAAGRSWGALLVADDHGRDFERAQLDLLTIAALHLAGRMQAAEEENRRRRLEEHLVQAQKMDAVGMLAGGIAHDFNNILSGILGFASMLRARVAPGSESERYLKLIEQSAGRAAELTRQLLSFSRKSHVERRPLSVLEVIEEVLALLRPSLPRNVEVGVQRPEQTPRILGDKSQMVQVVMNLCINAIEAMRVEGGRLNILVEVRPLTENEHKLLQRPIPGRAVCVVVSDTGPGIDPEVRAHIFDPFFTTKEEGTGLGLSIVYGIVTNHGGDVLVESEEGRGATFRIYLPEHVGRPPGRMPSRTGADTVLIVDDEAIVRQMMAEILKASGYPVLEASSGETAVDLFREHSRRIGLVILDMIMPGMDGAETFQCIREINRNIPCLLATGYARSDQCRRLMRRERVDLINKPFKSRELIERVASFLGPPSGVPGRRDGGLRDGSNQGDRGVS
ncbi:MAG TPA: response regulator [Kiritimatiellae bacterium]|nr:response regulator [Kiritimatiellia bacterium]